jgi:hypothetical protein
MRPEPKGLGTGGTQSLFSYLQDLADLHAVPLERLVWECCEDLRRKDNPSKLVQYWDRSVVTLLSKFSALTVRNDLDSLTMQPWAAAISSNHLLSFCHKWCPLCVRESDYGRLLWTLHDATACPIHKVKLEMVCSRCGGTSLRKARSRFWLVCSCGCPRKEGSPSSADRGELWAAEQLSKLIARGAEGPILAADRIYQVWTKVAIPAYGSGARANTAITTHLGLGNNILRGHYRLRIGTILTLSHDLGLDLVDVLSARIEDLRPGISPGKWRPVKRASRKTREELEKEIPRILETLPPGGRSMGALIQKLGASVRRFLQDFPDLAEKLKKEFAENKKRGAAERKAKRLQAMVEYLRLHGTDAPITTMGKVLGTGTFPAQKELMRQARLIVLANT